MRAENPRPSLLRLSYGWARILVFMRCRWLQHGELARHARLGSAGDQGSLNFWTQFEPLSLV